MRVAIPWARNSYTSESVPLSAQELINMYAEGQAPDAKSPIALFRRPGLSEFADHTSHNMSRGAITMAGVAYFVIDDDFVSISSAGVVTVIDQLDVSVASSTTLVSMATDGTTIAIADGTNGYFYTVAGGLVKIVDPDLNPPRAVAQLDKWFVFVTNDTSGQFQITNDTAIDALEFATAQADPDSLLTCWSDNRQLWMFGEKTIEVWWNSGNADFTFDKVQGGYIERGLLSQYSVASVNNMLYFVGEDGIAYRVNGYVPAPISTPPIEQEIYDDTSKSTIHGFYYPYKGHQFYVLQVNSKTYVYDVKTAGWHRLSYWDVSDSVSKHQPYLGRVSVEAYGKVLMGSRASGKIYEVSSTTYSDAGEEIRWEMNSPPFSQNLQPGIMSRLEIDFEAGTSLTTGQGSDSQVMLQISRDGGQTFGNERWTGVGKKGDYDNRAVWSRLGKYRKATVFKLSGSDAVRQVVMGSFLSIVGGTDSD